MKMLFTYMFLLSITLSQNSLWKDTPYRIWSKEYTLRSTSWFDEFKASIQTVDGGFVFTGATHGKEKDLLIIKTNSDGDTLWTKNYSGPQACISCNSFDWGNSIQQTSDGGFIITGVRYEKVDDDGTPGNDIWLIKTDSNGDIEWEKHFNGGHGNDSGEHVEQTSDGGYILTGSITNDAKDTDIWLIRTDVSGDTLWTKTFGEYDYSSPSMSFDMDVGYSVTQTTDGGFLITGTTGLETDYETSPFLLKTDSNGSQEWFNSLEGIQFGIGNNVKILNDGNYLVSAIMPEFGQAGLYIYKINNNGVVLFKKNIGGLGDLGWIGFNFIEEANGDLIFTGRLDYKYSSNLYDGSIIIKTNSEGNELWRSLMPKVYINSLFSIASTDYYVIYGKSSTGRPFMAKFITGSTLPIFNAIPDYNIDEDNSLQIPLLSKPNSLYPLQITLDADTAAVTSLILSDTLFLNPKQDWNGKTKIFVIATDSLFIDSVSFNLTVTPVQDEPTAFEWVSSPLDTVNITQTNTADVYKLEWTKSTDADGDTINYLLYAGTGSYPKEEVYDTTSTSVLISYQEFLENVFEQIPMVSGATVLFSIYAHDGTDSVKVTGVDRVVYVNRYEYLSTVDDQIPTDFALHENYPNPFNPTTTLRFDLPEFSDVNVVIYNMLGQKVRTFNMNSISAGSHSIKWNATNDLGDPVGAGVYLYQLQAKDFVKTRKMVLLK